MTLEKIAARKEFGNKPAAKLSRNTVWIFYSFTKLAASNDFLMKAFFYTASSGLRKLSVAS
jgi:farnesyl-diphosphate farnesyltransferase